MSDKPNSEDIAGGQALLEGVMMRHGNKLAAAVRRPDKEIVFQERVDNKNQDFKINLRRKLQNA